MTHAHPGGRARVLLLLALLGLQVVALAYWVRPGPLSIDEVLYQWMTRSAAEGQWISLASAYDELPSRELGSAAFVYESGGRLTSQYPPFPAWLAALLHPLLGSLALFTLNALAFVGVVALTWRVAWKLTGDGAVPLLAAGIFAGATYAWGYSVAAWPHMITLLAQVTAFACMLEALDRGAFPLHADGAGEAVPDPGPDGPAEEGADRRRRVLFAALAGLAVGVAVGFRRDAVFFLPVVAIPLLYRRPPRFRELGALLLATLPPLAVLAAVNGARWGIWSPVSYGRQEAWTGTLLALGAAGVAALVAFSRPSVQGWMVRRRGVVATAAFLAVAAAALAPPTRPWITRLASGLEGLLFDLRGTPTEVGMESIDLPEVQYLGLYKKAFLQSLPWLPLLVVPAVATLRRGRGLWKVALLLLPALAYVPVQALYERHGGLSANLRYFIPTLPFLAVLAAWAVSEIGRCLSAWWRGPAVLGAAGAASALAGWLLVRPPEFETDAASARAVLDAPLLLAGLVAAAAGWWLAEWWRGGRRVRLAASAALVAAGAAAAWAGCLAIDYDARWARALRTKNLVDAWELSRLIEPGAAVLTTFHDRHATLPDFLDDVVLAYPHADEYRDFRRVALHFLDAGRPVYGAMANHEWAWVQNQGYLEGLEMRVVQSGPVRVLELRRAPGDGG